MKKIRLTLRIEKNLYERNKAIADEEKRSLNAQIEYALEYYANDWENNNKEAHLSQGEKLMYLPPRPKGPNSI